MTSKAKCGLIMQMNYLRYRMKLSLQNLFHYNYAYFIPDINQHGNEMWELYLCNMLLQFYPKEFWGIEIHKNLIKLNLPSRFKKYVFASLRNIFLVSLFYSLVSFSGYS